MRTETRMGRAEDTVKQGRAAAPPDATGGSNFSEETISCENSRRTCGQRGVDLDATNTMNVNVQRILNRLRHSIRTAPWKAPAVKSGLKPHLNVCKRTLWVGASRSGHFTTRPATRTSRGSQAFVIAKHVLEHLSSRSSRPAAGPAPGAAPRTRTSR